MLAEQIKNKELLEKTIREIFTHKKDQISFNPIWLLV